MKLALETGHRHTPSCFKFLSTFDIHKSDLYFNTFPLEYERVCNTFKKFWICHILLRGFSDGLVFTVRSNLVQSCHSLFIAQR